MICGVSLISDTPPLSCLQAMAAYLNNLQTSHVEKKIDHLGRATF